MPACPFIELTDDIITIDEFLFKSLPDEDSFKTARRDSIGGRKFVFRSLSFIKLRLLNCSIPTDINTPSNLLSLLISDRCLTNPSKFLISCL